jgi:hypothetical protein
MKLSNHGEYLGAGAQHLSRIGRLRKHSLPNPNLFQYDTAQRMQEELRETEELKHGVPLLCHHLFEVGSNSIHERLCVQVCTGIYLGCAMHTDSQILHK